MYFEDEKENMKDGSALDELDLDINSSDDKSVTWDDLLDDDSDIDISTIKRGASAGDSLLDDTDDMLLDDDVLDDSAAEELRPAPQRRASTPRKDAFDVFGGSASQTVESYSPSDSRGDTITPDLTRRPSRSRAAFSNDEDDIYFEPKRAKKSSSGIFTSLVGILLAVALVGGLIYLFMTYGKSLTGFDVESLKKAVSPVQETQMPDINAGQPAIDINAPADVNANKEKTDEKAKTEEKKAEKFVTLSVQNGGRVNPFVPPAGFENSTAKYAFSDYEILTPPEEVPTDDTADEAKKLMNITVSGILFDNVKPSAIISVNGSDYFVQIGDKVDEFQVIAINTQYVAIKNGTNVYRAQVGESFNDSAKVGGMAQRQASGKFAGAKQYTSSSDVEVSVKDQY